MDVFIKGMGNISPQRTFDGNTIENAFTSFEANRLKCIEPDYSHFVDAKQIRRMSRVIKMGVASSMLAMKDAGLQKPEAVIVGTALGCLEDTSTFLSKMVEYKEDMLSPTAFIHSTHNTIASQIALLFECRGYNSTYVHRNISFESALIDAIMLLQEGSITNALVGGIDELTNTSFKILERLGHVKQSEGLNTANLYQSTSKGSIAGEGSAFFSLVNKPDNTCYAKIKAIKTISFTSSDQVCEKALAMLKENGIKEPNVLISAYNGDLEDDNATSEVVNSLGMQNKVLKYKHLCGEYATSAAFAMWLAAVIIKNKRLPQEFITAPNSEQKIENILIYNHYKKIHHSLILLSSC